MIHWISFWQTAEFVVIIFTRNNLYMRQGCLQRCVLCIHALYVQSYTQYACMYYLLYSIHVCIYDVMYMRLTETGNYLNWLGNQVSEID